jgi:glycosyltransferase involved in cell wall biosynthesis
MSSAAGVELSIIICSYARYDLLRESVAAVLNSKSFDPRRMELIVVDNTPPTRRRAGVASALVRVVPCDEPGLSRARNVGIEAARGALLAFVDDDALVDDDWCVSVIGAFSRFPEAHACGGRTVARHGSEQMPPWYYPALASYLSCIDWGEEPRPLRRGEWIVGANMAFRRTVFADGRHFDPALGRKGTASLLSNEEIALLEAIGLDHVYYIPDMRATHLVPADRLTRAWFRKRVFWQAVSDVLADARYITDGQALVELQDLVARAPAEHRGYNLLRYDPETPQAFREQLSAIYLNALLLAEGFSAAAAAH